MKQAVLNISYFFVACKTREIVHRLKKNQNRGDSWVVHLHHTQTSIKFNPKCTIYGHSFGAPTSVIARNSEQLPVEKFRFVKLRFCHIPSSRIDAAMRLFLFLFFWWGVGGGGGGLKTCLETFFFYIHGLKIQCIY